MLKDPMGTMQNTVMNSGPAKQIHGLQDNLYQKYGDPEERRMQRGLESGQKFGEQMTGITSEQLGQERGKVMNRTLEAMDQPSMRAKLTRQSNDDRMRMLKAKQRTSGMQGGMADSQEMEAGRRGDMEAAGIEQADRLTLEDRAADRLGNAAKGIASQRTAEAGLAIASRKVDPAKVSSGGGLTVICTELFKQGYMSDEIIQKDTIHGIELRSTNPDIYNGYIFLATPVVKVMKFSPKFTALISMPVMAWAHDMAGYHNPVGRLINKIGAPICGVVGKILRCFKGKGVFCGKN